MWVIDVGQLICCSSGLLDARRNLNTAIFSDLYYDYSYSSYMRVAALHALLFTKEYVWQSHSSYSVFPFNRRSRIMAMHPSEDHHRKAAEQHNRAAEQHIKAADLHSRGDHEAASQHAHLAHGHHIQATEHMNEAAKKHVSPSSPARA
jgi:hypothetical protein